MCHSERTDGDQHELVPGQKSSLRPTEVEGNSGCPMPPMHRTKRTSLLVFTNNHELLPRLAETSLGFLLIDKCSVKVQSMYCLLTAC